MKLTQKQAELIFGKQKEKATKNQKATKKVNDWASFSLNPRTEDEIRERLKEDKESVCLSYICENSVLSEEFIEELIKLTKCKNSKGNSVNRIDWDAISRKQKLSEEFILKHAEDVNWNAIFMNQDLSDQFKLENKNRINQNDAERMISNINN